MGHQTDYGTSLQVMDEMAKRRSVTRTLGNGESRGASTERGVRFCLPKHLDTSVFSCPTKVFDEKKTSEGRNV